MHYVGVNVDFEVARRRPGSTLKVTHSNYGFHGAYSFDDDDDTTTRRHDDGDDGDDATTIAMTMATMTILLLLL